MPMALSRYGFRSVERSCGQIGKVKLTEVAVLL